MGNTEKIYVAFDAVIAAAKNNDFNGYDALVPRALI